MDENSYEENIDFSEIGTIRNHESVNANIQIPNLLIPPYAPKLFKHQYQTVDRCLFAEGSGVINTKRGTFYSRLGVNANNPGSGKTAAMLGLSFFPVGEPTIKGNVYASSLTTIILPFKPRKYISCSIYLAPIGIIGNWKDDCDKFYGHGKYYEFGTEGNIVDDIKAERNDGTFSKKKAGKFDELYPGELNEFIKRKMHQYKIIIVSSTSLQYLIETFKTIQVDRIVIDELQSIVVTNQDNMREYFYDDVLDFLLRFGDSNATYYREDPFSRFTWLVTATPHDISKNLKSGTGKTGKSRYLNTWVDRNAPFLRDYRNAQSGHYMLPDMIERYIIKFPNSYVNFNKTGGVNYIDPYILQIQKPKIVYILEDSLGKDFNVLLENDDITGIKNYLNITNPDLIIQGVLDKLNDEIMENEKKKRDNKLSGGALANYVDKMDSEINKINQKIYKISLRSNENMKHEEFIPKMIKDKLPKLMNTKYPNKVDAIVNTLRNDETLQKGLLYLNFKDDDSEMETRIIRSILESGFDVRLPSSRTKAVIQETYGHLAQGILTPSGSRDKNKDIQKFRESTNSTIWIMKSTKDTAGLNFEFIDFIMSYSRVDEEEQQLGRADRPGRTFLYKYIVLEYVN